MRTEKIACIHCSRIFELRLGGVNDKQQPHTLTSQLS